MRGASAHGEQSLDLRAQVGEIGAGQKREWRVPHKTDPAVLAAFDTMIAGVQGVERKGATMPYCSINGNMYAMISKADIIGIRLNDNDLKAFLLVGGRPFEGVPGFVSKEYGAVPAAMMADARLMQTWFRLSFAYASRLPPKPTVSR